MLNSNSDKVGNSVPKSVNLNAITRAVFSKSCVACANHVLDNRCLSKCKVGKTIFTDSGCHKWRIYPDYLKYTVIVSS